MAKGRIQRILIVLAAGVLLTFAANSQAGVIQLGNSGWQAEWDPGLDPFVDIVVDGETSQAVFIQKFAEFIQPPVNGLFPPINIVFRQTQANAKPFIVIEDEVLTNSTGAPWFDFHFELVDSGDAVFDPVRTAASGGPGPIGWSISPFTNAAFGNGNTTLDVDGGVVPSGSSWFPGNGPSDGQLWIQTTPRTTTPFTVFTLKETPTIPEPGSLALLAIGGLALIRRK